MPSPSSRSNRHPLGNTGSSSPRLLLLFCMAVFGTVGLVVRSIPLPSGEIALWRAVLASLALLLYTNLSGQPLRVKDGRALSLLLLSGALMGFNWVALFEAYNHTTISNATLAYYTAPVLVTAMGALLLKERMCRLQMLCLLLALVGLGLIINPGGGQGGNHMLGVLLGLVSAVLYATVILINRFVQEVSGIHRTQLQFIAAIAVLLPYNLLRGGIRLMGMPLSGWLWLLLLGLFYTGVVYSIYFSVIRKLPVSEIAIISYMDPLVAVLCSALFLGEPMGWLQWLGGAIILMATYISGRSAEQKT